ncbi:hypothetical protein [Halorientalis salina]|uniref:hypothetical protein n=1 Tax=Halorientalis salina TaxID=2932266 RepID=UPI0010AC3569|nr:hypothetical protein [Halorientalis salina]
MTTIAAYVRDDRVNAGVAWATVLAAVLVAGWRSTAGDPLVAGLAVGCVVTAVLPATVRRDPVAMLPGELLVALVALLALRAAGVAVPYTGYGTVSVLALALAVDVDVLTPVDMAPWFSIWFVTAATMALAALWGITQYAVGTATDTTYLASNADLMWDLLAATAVGVAAGLLFERYVRRTAGLTVPSLSAPPDEPARQDRVPLSTSPLRYVVRTMQVFLLALVAYGVASADIGVALNAALGFGVTLVPTAVGRRFGRSMSAGLSLWITTAAFLHAVGLLGPYGTVGWFDQVTHTLSASLVAGVGYAAVQALDHHATDIAFPPAFRLVCVVLFVLAAGVTWELVEFGAGGLASLLGNEAPLVQYGLRDTVLDLVFDAVGALVVALWGTRYFDGVADLLSAALRTTD